MRQYLTAQQVQAANQIPLDEMVDAATLRNLKAREEHPEIRLYSIGHEGKANLNLPGIGAKTFTWIQAAIQSMADKLGIGTAVFDRHNPDTNSHKGREQIGEVVGKTVRKIGERLNTLAAIYIYPAFKTRPLDVASFEAEMEFDHDEDQAWPTNIRNVSGIALSNSGIDSPGFPGATLLDAVQAYAVQAFENEPGAKKMNQSEVQEAVKTLGLSPSDLFSVEDVVADKKVRTNLQEAATRVGNERDTSRERVAELENTVAESNKQLQQLKVQSKSAPVFDAVLADPERKLSDKAKKYVQRSLKNFTTTAEDEDALKVDVGKFVDRTVVEYGEVAKDVFGVDVGDKPVDNPSVFTLPPSLTVSGQEAPAGATKLPPPSAIPTREVELAAEMDPDINPLIPGGKAASEAASGAPQT